MKRILLIIALFQLLGCEKGATNVSTPKQPEVKPPVTAEYGTGKIVVCGSNKVYIINLEKSTAVQPAIEWQWVAAEATDLPLPYRNTYFEKMDECKPSADGTKLFVTSSSGGVGVIIIADKRILFYAFVPNAHSIEELPDGKLAVISSVLDHGNAIDIYAINKPEQSLYRDDFYSGHGLVWHKSKKVLYALGGNELRTYQLKNWQTVNPSLELVATKIQPGANGHDLRPVADSTSLIVTDVNNSYLYNLQAGTFSVYSSLANRKDIKSVSINKRDGRLLYVRPEESWWAFHVWIHTPDIALPIPYMNVYKARWLTE